MNIMPISLGYNPNFGLKGKVRIPMKNGTTALLTVEGDEKAVKITRICGDILNNGKVVGKIKDYHNKKGFDENRLAVICTELEKNAKDPESVVFKIFDAIMHPNFTHNG